MKFLTCFRGARFAWSAIAVLASIDASAQSVPTIDTEDATLGSVKISGGGDLHPQLVFDVRNGDFARGNYDDDRADLDRLPVHAQLGVAIDLSHVSDGAATSWLVLRSSNGFHAPSTGEMSTPRIWYESNNLAALVFTSVKGLRAAGVYTIKTSPNGVSATTHEASLSLAYDGDDVVGKLSPTLAVTMRPKGDNGVFTLAAIEPGFDLSEREDGPKLSIPVAIGRGRGGFYGSGSGSRSYLSAGAALEQPFLLGAMQWSTRLEALAVVRDDRLAALSGPRGETGTVVPLITWSVSTAY
ncbi:hypothetical protein [Sphingomonas sp. NFX23]|uniref:hypothetical protein n=1 Tax=Sphingomonas sp. NFX23 TaxID=2819532 RepID=UPI003CED0BDD